MNNERIMDDQNVNNKIGLCGFQNIGNTCYMNSILQLLIHSKLIINFMLYKKNPFIADNLKDKSNDAEYISYLETTIYYKIYEKKKKSNIFNNNIVINRSEVDNCMENTLTKKLADIINAIIYKGNSKITPTSFKQIIDLKISTLRGYGQQDSHELLNGFFDNLIEETGIDSEPKINNVPNEIHNYIKYVELQHKLISEEKDVETKRNLISDYNEYKKKNYDIINKYNGLNYMMKIFKSIRSSNLDTSSTGFNPLIFNLITFTVDIFTCQECSSEHHTYQYHTIIILPVKFTIKECFQHYINEELVSRNCEFCKHNKAMKKTKIWRPGMTLFIELNRFNIIDNRLYKNNVSVEIPHELDISEFCDNSMQLNSSFKYKLKGISNHIGNMNGGHYTADCLSIVDNKTWYHFDDSNVSMYDGSNIDTSKAYIILYELE